MNSQQITNVFDPTADQHAATKKYVDDEIAGIPGGGASELDDLSDVTIDSPANGQVLTSGDLVATVATNIPTTIVFPISFGVSALGGEYSLNCRLIHATYTSDAF